MQATRTVLIITIGALISYLSACTTREEAPPPNPALSQPGATKAPAKAAPQQGEPGQAEAKGKPQPAEKLPKLDGFADIKFGLLFAKAKKSKEVKERCEDKLFPYVADPEYAGQEIKQRSLLCTATVAQRYVRMSLAFDHNDELYAVEFSFDDPPLFGGSAAARKRKKLIGDEVDKFVADLRALLEPELGKPQDLSTAGITGRGIDLKWEAETSDDPPHKVAVELSMSSGLTDWQQVKWIDFDREGKMKAAIEKEKNERVKKNGL